ncbi:MULTISPECIES: phage tail tape measure protein [Rhizobiaceae]|uniref:Phage tail tape measure protein n=1 Tax=Peteryoungia algae TaxID=2919917 RepID=A0ABT0D4D7_9HYPH|nr:MULTISPECIES: phage tail tape measure protein [unclassified Rhizobium]MCC8934480.1 phage tail tape measure protein [Rhizobium sp. 'Codium 1']MCJ8240273.1 phage tail tape measure protein [Rhizobium sp. SSM4.3]
MTDDDMLALSVDLDGSQALAVLDDLESRSASFGRALTSALKGATSGGKGLEDVLRSVGSRLTDIALSAGLKPLEGLLGDAAGSLIGSLTSGLGSALGTGLTAYAAGGVPGRVMPFAEGGVVASPTYFPLAGGAGLMGEAGAEAILPLKRGADGALGVAAEGAGAGTVIHFQVTASDAASFARSEGQITAMLARSVGRGRRGL